VELTYQPPYNRNELPLQKGSFSKAHQAVARPGNLRCSAPIVNARQRPKRTWFWAAKALHSDIRWSRGTRS